MNYALIGCGRIATNHIKSALNNNLNIIAVCDIIPRRMVDLLTRYGLETDEGIKCYLDYSVMLEEHPETELVAIATESGAHAEIAKYCIERGINVIIEKPIAMSMEDADEIVRLSKQKGVTVSACHQNRFNIAVQKVRKALEDGRFGRISHGSIHVRWNRNKEYYGQASWRGTWAQDGGCLMNQCIHGIDLLRWMMGDEVVSVYGQIRNRFHDYIETEDVGVAVITFENGAIATIEGTTNVFPENLEEALYLFGESGTVKIGGKSVNSIDLWNFADELDEDIQSAGIIEATSNVYGNGHTSLYADVIDAIQTGRKPYVDAEAGKRALEIVLAIYKSMKTGTSVELPLKKFDSADMIGEL